MTGPGARTALVIGAGPAGLMAADALSAADCAVTIADQMPSPARKLLMAGKSGLNLTKQVDDFAAAYGAVPEAFRDAIADFGPEAVIRWAEALGQQVFTGSTGRVFPTAMKASPLLRAWLRRLEVQGAVLRSRWKWTGWAGDAALFETPAGQVDVSADITVLAMGGASWGKLGSDGKWAAQMPQMVAPFRPANVGVRVAWSAHMAPHFGQPVKAVALSAGGLRSRGEWVVTKEGIEGGGVYEVSSALRDGADLCVDLLPDLDHTQIAARLAERPARATTSQTLRKTFRLSPLKIALFNEFARGATGDLAVLLKAVPIRHKGTLAMDGAISTAGGLRFEALDGFRLRDGVYAAGEMLDWDAPTGGWLITACLATGRAAAQQALAEVRA